MRRLLLPGLLLVAAASLLGSTEGIGEPPEHLRPVLPDLERARIEVLVPPDRPPGTSAAVADAGPHFYRVVFTNDPEGTLSHAEQVNVFVAGSDDPLRPPPGAAPVEVRGREGAFFCGAAACFLDWEERDATYSVGEFGSPEDAVGFAESLVALDEAGGPEAPASDPEPTGPTPIEDGPPLALLAVVAAGAVLLIGALLIRRRGRP